MVDHWFFAPRTTLKLAALGLVLAVCNVVAVEAGYEYLARTISVAAAAALIVATASLHSARWPPGTLMALRVVGTLVFLGAAYLTYQYAQGLERTSYAALLQIIVFIVVGVRTSSGLLTDGWVRNKRVR